MSKKILVLVTVVIILFIGVFVKYAIPYYKNYTRLDEFEKHCYIFSGKANYSWYSDEMVEYEIRKTLKYAPVSLEELREMVQERKNKTQKGCQNVLNGKFGINKKLIIKNRKKEGWDMEKIEKYIENKKIQRIKQCKNLATPHYNKILEILNKMIEEKFVLTMKFYTLHLKVVYKWNC